MSQYIINTGNIANDGQGSPLRTAFIDTNLNFNQIWTAGPVGSNIQIANNSITSTNTNGNINLAPNGIGVVKLQSNFVPDQPNVRFLGTSTLRFNTVYTKYLDVSSATIGSNLQINGNLYVSGNIVTVGYSNLTVANTNITLAANAVNAAQADGGGLLLAGANANIVYSAADDSWNFNKDSDFTGNVSANLFIGDGSGLSNVYAVVNADALIGDTLSANVLDSSLTSVGNLVSLTVVGNIVAGNIIGVISGDGGNLANVPGTGVVGAVANATWSTYAGTANTANLSNVSVYSLTANWADQAVQANIANTANLALYSNYANIANTAVMATLANSAVVANVSIISLGLAANANISLTGNIQVGNILTDGYYYANGTPFAGGGGNSVTPPGGSNTQVQFNDGGVFGGDAGLTYNKTLNTLTSSNTVAASSLTSTSLQTTNATVYGNLAATDATVTGNLSATNYYIGNTLFTRTLTVGRSVSPVTVPLASNNSFNVLTAGGNVVVYTT